MLSCWKPWPLTSSLPTLAGREGVRCGWQLTLAFCSRSVGQGPASCLHLATGRQTALPVKVPRQWQLRLGAFSSFCVWPCVSRTFFDTFISRIPSFQLLCIVFHEIKVRRQKIPLHLNYIMPRWFLSCPLGFSCEDSARMWPKWLLTLGGWFPRSVPWFPPLIHERGHPSIMDATSVAGEPDGEVSPWRKEPKFRPPTQAGPESCVAASDLSCWLCDLGVRLCHPGGASRDKFLKRGTLCALTPPALLACPPPHY